MRWQDVAIIVSIAGAFLLFLLVRTMITPDSCANGGPKSQFCGQPGPVQP